MVEPVVDVLTVQFVETPPLGRRERSSGPFGPLHDLGAIAFPSHQRLLWQAVGKAEGHCVGCAVHSPVREIRTLADDEVRVRTGRRDAAASGRRLVVAFGACTGGHAGEIVGEWPWAEQPTCRGVPEMAWDGGEVLEDTAQKGGATGECGPSGWGDTARKGGATGRGHGRWCEVVVGYGGRWLKTPPGRAVPQDGATGRCCRAV